MKIIEFACIFPQLTVSDSFENPCKCKVEINFRALNSKTHQFRYHWDGIPLRLEGVVHVDVLKMVRAARSVAARKEGREKKKEF